MCIDRNNMNKKEKKQESNLKKEIKFEKRD